MMTALYGATGVHKVGRTYWTAMPDARTCSAFFSLILLFATACRFYKMDSASLWADELWGVDACSQGSWWAMVDNLVHKDSHPPGYQTLLYFWMQWFGDTDAAVRLPSVISGIAAVAALYRMGRVFFSPLTGVLASILLASSYNAIYYSQEARAYIFLLLFAILHFHALLQLFCLRERSQSVWLAFWVFGALLAYFHYVGVVLLLTEAMLAPFLLPRENRLSLFFKAFAPLLLVYVPWLPVMFIHLFHADPSFETPVPTAHTLWQTAGFIWGPETLRLLLGAGATMIFCCWCSAEILRRNLGRQERYLLLLLLLVVVPILMFFVKSRLGQSAYTVRHFIYAIPVAALLNAWLLERAMRVLQCCSVRSLMVVLVIVGVGAMNLNISSALPVGGKLYSGITKIEYRQAVETIVRDAGFMQAGNRNIFVSNKFFDHYLLHFHVRDKPAPFMHQNAPEKIGEYMKQIADEKMNGFYYLEVFMSVETREPSPILKELQKHYYAICATQFFWVQVFKFSTLLPPIQAEHEVGSCPREAPVPLHSSAG